jgi:hypothetical protein
MASGLQTPTQERFEQIWATGELERRTAALTPHGTLRPSASAVDDGLDARLVALPPLLRSTDAGGPPELALGPVLGVGGMGVVRSARQLALGREVAVKTVRGDLVAAGPGARSDACRKLLAEAMVAGQLDHPDILPVYALGQSEDGAPMLVMKKVEGTSWSSILAVPDHPALEGKEPLIWHLEVLSRVCRAVHFAHSRGILHRDLKSENVMVGRFGEVYVLDWGIAVATVDDGTGTLPLAAEARELVGTPATMAPEMVAGSGAQLGPWTDVFLLGSLLHEILTGRCRNEGPTIHATLWAAFVCAPSSYDDDVPAELAAIAERACARDPEDRFASADALRFALEAFVSQRAAVRLLVRARDLHASHREDLDHARGLLADAVAAERALAAAQRRARPDDVAAALAARRYAEVVAAAQGVERSFAEVRLALREAARVGLGEVGVAESRAELDALVTEMVSWHLDGYDPIAAARWIDERSTPDIALIARLNDVRAAVAAHDARIAHLRREMDPNIGARTRAFLALVLGGSWLLTPALLYGAKRLWAFEPKAGHLLLATGYFLELVLRTLGWWLELPLHVVLVFDEALFAGVVGVLAATQWPRMGFAAAIFLTCAIAVALRPTWGLTATSLANALAMMMIAYAWRPTDYEHQAWLRLLNWEVGGRCELDDGARARVGERTRPGASER